MTHPALEIVVNLLAGKGILADQVTGNAFRDRPTEVFADDTLTGMHARDAGSRLAPSTLLVHLVEAIIVGSQVPNLVGEIDVLDFPIIH